LIKTISGNVGIGTTTPASTLTITGNFSATGTKSAVVNTSYGIRKLYAMESPDVRFYDEGRARLNNGMANISLDPIFIETIEPNYQVYLTPKGKTQGIYVDEQAKEYFIVKGNNPSSNVEFSWLISAIRKGYSETRMELERKEGNVQFIATIDEQNKITDIEVKGDDEIANNIKNSLNNKNVQPSIASGDKQTESANAITGNAVNELASTNNGNSNSENKFQISASAENDIISQIKEKTNLNLEQIKKSITFRKKQASSEDSKEVFSEIPSQKLTRVTEINGSVIVKLG